MVALVPSDASKPVPLPQQTKSRLRVESSKRNTATHHSAWDDGGREKGHFNCSGQGIATLAHREQDEGHSYLLLPNAPAKNYEGHRGPQLPTASALPSRRDDFTSATLPSRRHATIPSRRDDFMLCNAPQSEG
ncbi:UNVERIFIED_CONTAM: hypothetical protein K2H54_036199 [Gekko kuhli]